MDFKEILDFISHIEFFNELDEKELKELSDKMIVQNYTSGQYLFKENKNRESVFIIYAGDVELLKKNPNNEQKRLAYFSMGDIIGEGAFVDDSPHSTSTRTVTACTVFTIGRNSIEEVFTKNPALGLKISTRLAKSDFEKNEEFEYPLCVVRNSISFRCR
jgi:CRP-like cAMP-binding protein